MKVDPFAPQLLLAYDIFCREHRVVPFQDFVALWHADAVMQAALAEGHEPSEVRDLIFPRTEGAHLVN